MRKYLESLVRDLGKELEAIEQKNIPFLERAQWKLNKAQEALKKLTTEYETKPFKNTDDEITYYKHLKPEVCSQVLFLEHVVRIEALLPIGRIGSRRDFLISEQMRLERIFEHNKDLFEYLRNKRTDKDAFYFSHSSINRNWVSSIRSCEMLHHYLQEKLAGIQASTHANSKPDTNPYTLPRHLETSVKWTGTKTELVELIYALHANGSINSGKGTIKAIAEAFEINLDTNLSDYRFTYKEIKNRYKPDKFLNKLAAALTQKVQDELD